MAYEYTRDSSLYEDVCCLCTPDYKPDKNGVLKDNGYKKREVFCLVGSLYSKEFYAAFQSGISEAMKFVVNRFDWEEGREMILEHDGKLYTIYRTFMSGDQIELYARIDAGTWSGTVPGQKGRYPIDE